MALNQERTGPSDDYIINALPNEPKRRKPNPKFAEDESQAVCGTCGRFPCHPRCADY